MTGRGKPEYYVRKSTLWRSKKPYFKIDLDASEIENDVLKGNFSECLDALKFSKRVSSGLMYGPINAIDKWKGVPKVDYCEFLNRINMNEGKPSLFNYCFCKDNLHAKYTLLLTPISRREGHREDLRSNHSNICRQAFDDSHRCIVLAGEMEISVRGRALAWRFNCLSGTYRPLLMYYSVSKPMLEGFMAAVDPSSEVVVENGFRAREPSIELSPLPVILAVSIPFILLGILIRS
jgi:hypothetical protein